MKNIWIGRVAFFILLGPACSREMFCAPCAACPPAAAAAKPAEPAAADGSSNAAATKTAAPVDSDAHEHHAKTAVAKEAPLPEGRVRNAKEYFATLDKRFQPAAAKGLHAIFQFDLTGDEPYVYQVAVDDGKMKMKAGRAPKADVTITTTAEEYVKVVNGEVGGTNAVLGRKMKVSGNLTLARKMKAIFPGGHPDKNAKADGNTKPDKAKPDNAKPDKAAK